MPAPDRLTREGDVLHLLGGPLAVAPAEAKETSVQARRAFVASILNVKAASVCRTPALWFLPAQAVGLPAMPALALVHVADMAACLGAWSAGLTAAVSRLHPQRRRARIDRAGGIALGARSATQTR